MSVSENAVQPPKEVPFQWKPMLIINWWGFISKQTSLWLFKKWGGDPVILQLLRSCVPTTTKV